MQIFIYKLLKVISNVLVFTHLLCYNCVIIVLWYIFT